jgi:glycosyltransferase involved in cell wall biosynthesis
MKIAFLNYYQEVSDRGAETFIKELSGKISEKYQVDIIAGINAKPQSQVKPKFIWRLFLDAQSLTILKFTLSNFGKIWKAKYDVIIPLNGGWQPAIIRILTWLRGGKMIIVGQSGIGWDDINNLWCLPNAFVAISTYAAKWAKKVNPFCKIIYIPNGVDTTKFTSDGKKVNHNLKSPVVLAVAALTKSKRIDLVIKAVAETDASLLICGKGEEKEKLRALGTRLLGNRFKIIESDYKEMPEVYRSANLFTLASTSVHAFEIVLLEAMASGLPVVANQDPIRQEIVGDAGYLVNPEEITEYTERIQKALSTNWGNKPQKQAEKFDWAKISKDYENLFNNSHL